MTITPIHGEVRQAAHERLIELANELMQSAQSLVRKSGRVMDPDPKVHNRVIAGLRRHRDAGWPGSDEVLLIEALLTGTPPEECLGRAERNRLEKLARQKEHDELWDRIRNSPNPREAWERTDFSGKKKKALKQGDNVVAGPWGAAGRAGP